MVSVRLGARETMRWTDSGMRTLRPGSSVTSVNDGVGAGGGAFCAAALGEGRSRTSSMTCIVLGRLRRLLRLLWLANDNFNLLKPKKKNPHEIPWGNMRHAFSRSMHVTPAREGSLADGALGRSQWRDRGRFSRPSPLPVPANYAR